LIILELFCFAPDSSEVYSEGKWSEFFLSLKASSFLTKRLK